MMNYYNKVKGLVQKLQDDVVGLYNQILDRRQRTIEALEEAATKIPDLQAKIDRYGSDDFLNVDRLWLNSKV